MRGAAITGVQIRFDSEIAMSPLTTTPSFDIDIPGFECSRLRLSNDLFGALAFNCRERS